VVPKGNKQETYPGPVALRETGSLDLKTSTATVEGINHKHCRLIQLGDGYGLLPRLPFPALHRKAAHFRPRPQRRGLKRMKRMNCLFVVTIASSVTVPDPAQKLET
jgi:hypothetical protein